MNKVKIFIEKLKLLSNKFNFRNLREYHFNLIGDLTYNY